MSDIKVALTKVGMGVTWMGLLHARDESYVVQTDWLSPLLSYFCGIHLNISSPVHFITVIMLRGDYLKVLSDKQSMVGLTPSSHAHV